MAENNEKGFLGNFFESLDLRDIIVAGMLVPLGTEVIAPMGKDLLAKLFTKAGKAVGEKFGLNTEESKKVVTDNVLYGKVRFDLDDPEKIKELLKFEKELRAGEDGDNRFAALVLYISLGVASLKKETKKGGGKDKDGKEKEAVTTVDDSVAMAWAKRFLVHLLSFDKFEERVQFLEHEDVFKLIKEKKETIDLIKKAIDLMDGAVEGGQKFFEQASENFKKIDEKIENSILTFEDRARIRCEAARARHEASKIARRGK